jgi:hypothetical protein
MSVISSMIRPNLFVVLAACVLSGVSCREQASHSTAPAGKSEQKFPDGRILGKDAVLKALKNRTFISRGGNFQGTDNDEVVSFRQDGTLEREIHSVGPLTVVGTFEVDDATGEISTTIREEKDVQVNNLPKMIVVEKSGKILLFRADGKTHWMVPADFGAEGEPTVDGFWPFAEKNPEP